MACPPPFCFSAFLLFCFFLPLARSGDLHTDAEALLAFSSKLDTGGALASWNASAEICADWRGISCANSSATSGNSSSALPSLRVVAVLLPNALLSGPISPSTLGLLDALQNLSLSSNHFYGDLPPDLANCSSLRSLLLDSNAFSGPLASSMFSWWPLLQQIDLSFNSFNGSIPSSIAEASSLVSVSLQNNSFSGSIPQIASSHLQSFNAANNELEGEIPSSLANFSALSFAGNEGLCGRPLNEICASRDPASKLSDGATVGIVIGVVLGGIFLLLMVKYIHDKNPIRKTASARANPKVSAEGGNEEASAIAAQTGGQDGITARKVIGEPRLVFAGNDRPDAFDIDSLLHASAEVMGNGSLGTAYKAMVQTSEQGELFVVVKRLNFRYKPEYGSHLQALAGLRHENLVPIKAWFFFEDEKLVVYDYIQGSSSLHALLHRGETRFEWKTRLWVAEVVARAMAFMHERQMVHGNIKSSNVLVSSEGQLGMTDYGLVQLAADLPQATAVGSRGYTAPELLDLARATTQSDVYSYGVLLLELLTGRDPLHLAAGPGGGAGRRNYGEHVDLPRWVQSVVREQWTAEVFDMQVMRHEFIQEEMMQLLQIALPCISPSPAKRPSMSDLATSIELLTQSDGEESISSP